MGFPDNPAGKESTAVQETLVCFLGQEDPLEKWGKLPTPVFLGIPGQMVKNLPAMRQTWIQSLDCEDPLEQGMATHSSILA